MANNQMVTPSHTIKDYVVQYGYPATAYVMECENSARGPFHLIWYAGANGGLFANAPLGSILINITSGAPHIEVCSAVPAGVATWNVVA